MGCERFCLHWIYSNDLQLRLRIARSHFMLVKELAQGHHVPRVQRVNLLLGRLRPGCRKRLECKLWRPTAARDYCDARLRP